MTLTIRAERAVDHRVIFEVIYLAFVREAEAHLVDILRQTPNYIPELSPIALEDDQILVVVNY